MAEEADEHDFTGVGYLTESIRYITFTVSIISVYICISLTSLTNNSAAMEHFVACIIHSLQAVLKRNPHVPKAFKAKTTQNCLQGRKSVSCLSCKQVFETL